MNISLPLQERSEPERSQEHPPGGSMNGAELPHDAITFTGHMNQLKVWRKTYLP